MKKPRRIFYLVAGVTTAMAVAAACDFPEPRIVDDGDSGNTDGDGPDATSDVLDQDVVTDGGALDVAQPDSAPPIGDATSEKPPVDANCNPCDCDNDGFLSEAGTCFDGGTLYDCDDQDLRANPDAGYRSDFVTNDTKGDWNCDRTFNREYFVNFKCGDIEKPLFGSCSAFGGFGNDPPCGELSTYVTCANPAIGSTKCVPGPQEQKQQRCK